MSEAANLTPSTSDPVPPSRDDSKTAVFHLRRSNLFRVVHTDGVWCSETPNRLVQLQFFSEGLPLPEQTFYDLEGRNFLGDEQLERRIIQKGYIREVEVAAVVDRNTLVALQKWIGDYLARTKSEGSDATI